MWENHKRIHLFFTMFTVDCELLHINISIHMQNGQKNTKSMILQTIILLDKHDGGNTESKVGKVEIGKSTGGISPHRIQKETGISSSMIHRALNYLCKEGVIRKNGTPPKVTYEISTVNYEHFEK